MRQIISILLCFLSALSAAAAEEIKHDREVLEWDQLPPLPDPIGFAGPFVGVSNDALIVGGGANFPDGRPWEGYPKIWYDRIFVLTQPDGKWRRAGKLPRPLAYGVSLTTKDGVVCVGGGDKEKHYADAFMIKWIDEKIEIVNLPPMPTSVAYFCGAALNNILYVTGGLEKPDSPTTLKTFWALDLSKKGDDLKWQELKPWPGRPRMLAVAAAQAGSFFLFSGADLIAGEDGKPKREYLKDAYRYAPGRGWKRIADLPRATVAAPTPAVSLSQSHILVFSGDNGKFAFRLNELKDKHPGFPSEILAYHTITDTWIHAGDMPRKLGPDPAKNPNAGVWPAVTTTTTCWRGNIVMPSGEVRPGVRTPRVLIAKPKKYEARQP